MPEQFADYLYIYKKYHTINIIYKIKVNYKYFLYEYSRLNLYSYPFALLTLSIVVHSIQYHNFMYRYSVDK